MSSLTIIIPTLDRPADVQSTVTQLLRQSFYDFELWVVDQSRAVNAVDNRSFVEKLCDERVHYLHLQKSGLPNARNEALARARGEIVLFVDDDVVLLSDNFVAAHVKCYDDPTIGGVTGRHVERSLRSNTRRTACHVSLGGRTIVNLFGNRRQEIGSCKGSNMSFRMAAVRQIGGFDRRTHMLEDTDFSVRVRKAGWRLVFEPAAELLHLSTPSGGVREGDGLPTECQQFRSTAYYVLKHRALSGVPTFVITFTLIAMLRAVRFRSVSAIFALYRAMSQGFSDARRIPDQALYPNVLAASSTLPKPRNVN